jgi:tetratricopeptide (TPR) repeat protein
MNNLALVLSGRGRETEALDMFGGALEILHSLFGERHPDIGITLSNMASLYRKIGFYDVAEMLYVRAHDSFFDAHGAEHPHTAMNYACLAAVYREQRRYKESEALYRFSLRVLEDALGETHVRVRVVIRGLAQLYNRLGRGREALELEARLFDLERMRA